jgi:microcin C transport system substrate-binding protein
MSNNKSKGEARMSKILGVTGLILTATLALGAPVLSQEREWKHYLSYLEEVKYPAGFTHFDYVNVDAPKMGLVRLREMGGFDTLNPVLPQGEPANGLGFIYETLFTPSYDEILTDYGLLAEAVSYPDDVSSVTFRMNPDARWHDGEPVTAADVIWSFAKSKEVNPNVAQYYANVVSAEETAPGEVTFTFDTTGNLELPKIMGQLAVYPKHWWEGTDASGKQRDIGAPTLEPPLGSGPYRIANLNAGRNITYELVPDYWGVGHPTQVGHNNLRQVRYEYFLDLEVAFEAFKGDQVDYWPENRASRWATAYDFPAVAEGRVVREELPNDDRDRGFMVGWGFNLRKPMFQNAKLREAFNWAYDFEEMNRTLFYGQYERVDSYLFGAPEALRATGLPEGEELEILDSIRELVPERVFTTEYTNPVAGDPQKLRANLRVALGLLEEAGYTLEGNRLVDSNGKQLSFEMLLNGPTQEPQALAFQKNLQTIGIDATIRSVDTPQFINRLRSFDFDVTYVSWGQSLNPGNEQRYFWGSVSRDEEGSQNYLGIADPGIDALIDKIIFADDRETLEAATRALDRVLLAHHFVVPSYGILHSRIARWDRFGHPDPLPEFAVGFPTIWWWDAEKAAKTGGQNTGP